MKTKWDRMDGAARISRARRKMLDAHQFWGVCAMKLSIIREDGCETAATDGVHLFYNEAFICGLSEKECIGLVAHEIEHCRFFHFDRGAWLERDEWNICGDLAINYDLTQAGFTLPPDGLFDHDYKDMSLEEIANVRRRGRNNQKQRQATQSGRGAPQAGAGTGQPGQPGTPASGQPSQSGDGEVGDGTPDSDKPCAWGKVMPSPKHADGSPYSKSDMQALKDEWNDTVRQALGAARKAGKMAGGHIPTDLVRVSEQLTTPKTDWRAMLRQFIDAQGSRQSDFNKPDKRFIAAGLCLPSPRVIRPSTVGVMIDVSGSMDRASVVECLTEAQAILDDGACDAIELVYTDTRVTAVDTYEAGDTITCRDSTGGGTDFSHAMHYAAGQDYACIVFLTDGDASSFGQTPACPVLWGITGSQSEATRVQARVPFGECVSLYS